MSKPACVIDNGTGYTKMGFAGNVQPNFIVPSLIAVANECKDKRMKDVHDLDFYAGAEAMQKRENYDMDFPIRHGVIDNWDNMEKYWQRCIFEYLCCDPEEHMMLLTEPPLNTPENREYTAEIMFETFNVPGLYIAVQAVLALFGSISFSSNPNQSVTGTVVDSGDGVTHVIPVYEGHPIGSCIKHIPLAGRDVTNFVVQQLRDRGEPLPPQDALDVAKKIKESFCYIAPDLVREFKKYDTDEKKFRQYVGKIQRTGKEYKIDVGYERFLGPEIFFSPEIFSPDFSEPLPKLVNDTILNCPRDCQKALFGYITLSGGTTMFKHFVKRLERDIKRFVTRRFEFNQKLLKKNSNIAIKQTPVNVVTHKFQRFAVWFGGSVLANKSEFKQSFNTRAMYQEIGPRIARSNLTINSG